MLARLVSSWGYDVLSSESDEAGLRLLDGAGAVALVMSDFQPMAGEPNVRDYLTRPTGSPAPPFLCTLPSPGSPEDVWHVPRPFDIATLRDAVDHLTTRG